MSTLSDLLGLGVKAWFQHERGKLIARQLEELRAKQAARAKEEKPPSAKKVWDAKTKHKLTEHEKTVAQEAISFFNDYWWGSKIDGLSVAGLVAQERGAKFILEWGYWLTPEEGRSERIARQALDDVEEWLGLTHEQ